MTVMAVRQVNKSGDMLRFQTLSLTIHIS
ncbi:uncharacterized protein METZ01_LOCUS213749, partial [marine metagenome]